METNIPAAAPDGATEVTTKQQERIKELEQRLSDYGFHQENCDCLFHVDEGFWTTMHVQWDVKCSCGWDAIERELREKRI